MAGSTPLPSPREPRRFYRPELDIVRLCAFLAVFATHSNRPPGEHYRVYRAIADAGSFGLSLFFVLSAYLITTLLLREKDAKGTVAIGKFYQRRMLRIWPLYLLALAYAALWSFHLGTLNAEKWWFAAALVMAGNFVTWPGNLAGHLWSISIEEQFYVLWPSAMKWLNRARLAWLAALLVVAANVTLVYLGRIGASLDQVWGNTLVEFEMFGAGTLLALFLENPRRWLTHWWARIPIALAVPATWYAVIVGLRIKLEGGPPVGPVQLCLGYGLVALSSCLLIYALLGFQLWPKWAIYFGKISYGLYVFHIPCLYFVNHELAFISPVIRRPIALVLTGAVAAFSYRYFESFFLKLKERLEIVPSRPVETDEVPVKESA
jgi:peptidoglycan/LPS O-acetylase OafA/YrhL